jgi:NAD(P)-dependent dehydrogenase (short-subunit alcohol dehydrogenase family)
MERHVVITGASSGIGRATALHLEKKGFRVFAGVRKEADALSLREEGAEGIRPVYIDLLSAASLEAAAKSVAEAVGDAGLYGLVNNAGISVLGPLEFLDLDELRRQLEVNVVSQIAVTQAFLPPIRKARGRIVNVGSSAGFFSGPLVGPYAASKFAMEAISDSQRVELQPFGIQVSLVEPGAINTPMFDKGQRYADAFMKHAPEKMEELYGTAIAAVRAAYREMAKTAIQPEQVARAVHHALTAKRPRPRYLVGLDARIQVLLSRLAPTRLKDFILTRMLRYPRETSGGTE